MRTAGKLGEDVPFMDALDHRRINRIEPVSDSFFERYFTLLIEPHEIMMHFDVLHQIGVRSRRSDGDVRVRSENIEPRAFQKISELGLQDEILCLNSRRKGTLV
jgi:hypothetical protein